MHSWLQGDREGLQFEKHDNGNGNGNGPAARTCVQVSYADGSTSTAVE
jgi:hypothetical protein